MTSADLQRPLMSFSTTIQQDKMASYQSSYHSSVTDDDLEEARQRLLAHQYHQDTEDSEPNLTRHRTPYQANGVDIPRELPRDVLGNPNPPPTVVVDHLTADNQSRGSRYGSVSTTVSVTTPQKRVPTQWRRYRLPLLILLAFNWGLVVFLSLICWVLHVSIPVC